MYYEHVKNVFTHKFSTQSIPQMKQNLTTQTVHIDTMELALQLYSWYEYIMCHKNVQIQCNSAFIFCLSVCANAFLAARFRKVFALIVYGIFIVYSEAQRKVERQVKVLIKNLAIFFLFPSKQFLPISFKFSCGPIPPSRPHTVCTH